MSRRRIIRAGLWGLVVLLLLPPFLAPPPPASGAPELRLLGPFLELAARIQWIRFQRAHLAGDEIRALELADSALALDPRATEGWEALSAHLALFLGTSEREPDLARRVLWFQAALGVLERGRGQAADPGKLELTRALLLANKAERDPGLAPGGARELYHRAAEAFEQAARLGAREAAGLADLARERAAGSPEQE